MDRVIALTGLLLVGLLLFGCTEQRSGITSTDESELGTIEQNAGSGGTIEEVAGSDIEVDSGLVEDVNESDLNGTLSDLDAAGADLNESFGDLTVDDAIFQ